MAKPPKEFRIVLPTFTDDDISKEVVIASPYLRSKNSRVSTKETLVDSNSDRPVKIASPERQTLKRSFNLAKMGSTVKAQNQASFDIFASQKAVLKPLPPKPAPQTPRTASSQDSRKQSVQANTFFSEPDGTNELGSDKVFKIKDNFLAFVNRPAYFIKVLGFGTQNPFLRLSQVASQIPLECKRKDVADSVNCHSLANHQRQPKGSIPKVQIGVAADKREATNNENVELSFCGNSQLLESLAQFKEAEYWKTAPFASNTSESLDYKSEYYSDNIRSLNSFLDRNASKAAQNVLRPNEDENERMNRFFDEAGKMTGTSQIDKYFSGNSLSVDFLESNTESKAGGMFSNLLGSRANNNSNANLKKVFKNELFDIKSSLAEKKNFEKKGVPDNPFAATDLDVAAFGTQRSDDYRDFMESDKDLKYASFSYRESVARQLKEKLEASNEDPQNCKREN